MFEHSKRTIGSFLGISKLCLQVVPSLSESRVSTLLGSIIALLILATLVVTLRLAARHVSEASFGLDDLFIVLALVSHLNPKIQSFIRSPRADANNEVIRLRE